MISCAAISLSLTFLKQKTHSFPSGSLVIVGIYVSFFIASIRSYLTFTADRL
jgi:branched-subunit amino acid ABC-type transport system permease component